jgi:hypothetical protein
LAALGCCSRDSLGVNLEASVVESLGKARNSFFHMFIEPNVQNTIGV